MQQDQTHTGSVRVGIISLGCAKNLVDAEIMLGSLLKDGLEITNNAAEADVVIVNTCSFIDSAQEESVDTILESAQVREASNRGQGLIVSGCLPQRFRDSLPKLLPEVDAFMGIDQVAHVTEIVHQALQRRRERLNERRSSTRRKAVIKTLAKLDHNQPQHSDEASLRGSTAFGQTRKVLDRSGAPLVKVDARPKFVPDFGTPRFRLTPRHFAYVKIAEGCNHPCSFCIIPRMRGSHRSRLQSDVLQEARQLISDGVKELNLISQDTTYYGLDLRPARNGSISSPEKFKAAAQHLPQDATTLCTLLRELNSIPGDFWIRLLYTHPAHWTDELVDTIAQCPKVARYVDMPLQHIHGNMLERMRRETSREHITDLIQRIRHRIPGIALRTTFIVGFPGETEACFQDLLQFVREARFERLGVFTYSKEDATRAAQMQGHLPEKLKQRRRDQVMTEQRQVASSISSSFVGRTVKVLIEKEASSRELKSARIDSWEHGQIRAEESKPFRGHYLIARGEADAPDIDGRVYIKGSLPIGEFAAVRVIRHTDYDLVAQPV